MPDIELLDGKQIKRPRGRPKKLRPSSERPVGKTHRPVNALATRRPKLSTEEMLDQKVKILALLESSEATTLTEAAEKCGLTAVQVYSWSSRDPDFHDLIEASRQVVADRIEKEFQGHGNFIPKMMLLKGYRPMFREGSHLTQANPNLEKLLAELKEAGRQEKAQGVPTLSEPAKSAPIIDSPDFHVKDITDEAINNNRAGSPPDS